MVLRLEHHGVTRCPSDHVQNDAELQYYLWEDPAHEAFKASPICIMVTPCRLTEAASPG